MISFAFEGITSFSVKPIRMVTVIGIGIFICSLIYLLYSLIRYFLGETVRGWTSIIFAILAVGGLQMLSIGIIGEYIGKIYFETKERPKYIVEEYIK